MRHKFIIAKRDNSKDQPIKLTILKETDSIITTGECFGLGIVGLCNKTRTSKTVNWCKLNLRRKGETSNDINSFSFKAFTEDDAVPASLNNFIEV